MTKTICQKIADFFAPQTTPHATFSVPKKEEVVFDWHPVLEEAKLFLSKEAEAKLSEFNDKLKIAKESFNIEISSYRNKTIKIIRDGRIDVIPIEDIRKVSLVEGKAPNIQNGYFRVSKDGATTLYETAYHYSFDNEHKQAIYAPLAFYGKDDIVEISPIIEITCPVGLGNSLLLKIQELMAE